MDISVAATHIQKLYFDTCTVYERREVKEGHKTYQADVAVYTDIPCHVSHNRIIRPKTTEPKAGAVAHTPHLTSKLSLSPEYVIKAGSKILVTRNGVTTSYKNSSAPSVFPTHQEIAIDIDDDYA